MNTQPTGAVLLEVLVALTVLALVGLSAAALEREASAVMMSSDVSVIELEAASDLLEVATLWPLEDLVRHLGTTSEGQFLLRVSARGPTVFHLSVQPALTTRVVLATDVYRARRGAP